MNVKALLFYFWYYKVSNNRAGIFHQFATFYGQIKKSHSIHILSIQINTKRLDWFFIIFSTTSNCPSLQERLIDVVRMLGILKYGYIYDEVCIYSSHALNLV